MKGEAEINKDTIVKVTVDKPEVSSLHIALYKQMTNRKPSYSHAQHQWLDNWILLSLEHQIQIWQGYYAT